MDRSSNSRPEEVVVTHLDWTVQVDFAGEYLEAEATYSLRRLNPTATALNLDTADLDIESVTTSDGKESLSYILHPLDTAKPHLGRRLEIALPPTVDKTDQGEDIFVVTVVYKTTASCSALQWLPPSQTAGKMFPYLFTQCQAIHARSLVPCQDRCGVKMTYKAKVTVPSWSTCVMSAVLESTEVLDDAKVYTWYQPVPISSYLLALAVGELAKKDISDRCAIWSEPSIVEQAAYEFAETEDFLVAAETISGKPYAWGRYDVLCLPPSFPFGGMENPCLTFVTPTLLAGDRSLADVVAHEISHSWTGNLVTNATWDHFWLNEGWTTWFQRKIMSRIKNDPKFLDFDAIEGRKAMTDSIISMTPKHTRLVLDIGDDDPDDSYSVVSYEKGFTFLLYLERLVGTPEFEAFFQAYVTRFAAQTLTSDDFKSFFLEHFGGNEMVKTVDWDVWFYAEGMPPVLPPLDQSMAKASHDLASIWMGVDRRGQAPPSENEMTAWSSLQIVCFLDALHVESCGIPLRISTLREMDELYHLASSKNSEILMRYCELAIPAEDASILPIATRFITTQGRMKFVRPLYKLLYKSEMGRDLAVATFLQHKDFYHPICAKMVAIDLKVTGKELQPPPTINPWFLTGAAVLASGIVIALLRGKRT